MPSSPSGFLIVHKPAGVTSHDVVGFIRRRLKTQKVGHAGTLDPMATGVLVVGVGAGTRLLEYLVGADKEYEAEVTFGGVSDTYDAEGEVTPTPDVLVFDREILAAALPSFRGNISQIPPIYSAIKINGQSAHRLARSGETVEMKARDIVIHDIRLVKYAWPRAELHVHCGSGTYIRSLAHDLGQTLKTGAYLSRLVRTRVGDFYLRDAVTLPDIRADALLPIETAVKDFPHINLTAIEADKICLGQKLPARTHETEPLAGFFGGRLIAILRRDVEKDLLCPIKVFAAGCETAGEGDAE